MRRATSGYTIVEVLIVLLVSGILLASAIALVGSLRPETEFTQGVFDMRAKIESVIRGTGNTLFPNVDNYDCTAGTNSQPTLTVVANKTIGTRQGCIFLGRAIRVDDGDGKLYVYSVIGNRTYTNNGITEPVTSLDKAFPTVPNFADLKEVYTNDAPLMRLKSVSGDGSANVRLAGFYTNLTDSVASITRQSSAAVLSMAYDLAAGTPESTALSCIQSGCNVRKFTKWNLCFQSLGGNRTALLSIVNNASGVTTSVKFFGC